jgi:hypothetical protein
VDGVRSAKKETSGCAGTAARPGDRSLIVPAASLGAQALVELISVHVPKTAGTAFGKLLGLVYRPERVVRDYDDFPMNPTAPFNADPVAWRRSADAFIAGIGPEVRALHGHFSVCKYQGHFPNARRVAWVRHPVTWVISLYFFWKTVPMTPNPVRYRLRDENLSLLEFAEIPRVRNQFAEVFFRGLDPEGFDFVGLQEHFADDYAELTGRLNWPTIEPPVENRNPAPEYQESLRRIQADPALWRRLADLNAHDLDLYERAVRIRSLRLQAATAVRVDVRAAG